MCRTSSFLTTPSTDCYTLQLICCVNPQQLGLFQVKGSVMFFYLFGFLVSSLGTPARLRRSAVLLDR